MRPIGSFLNYPGYFGLQPATSLDYPLDDLLWWYDGSDATAYTRLDLLKYNANGHSVNVTLSGSDYIATKTSAPDAFTLAQTNASFITGKHYFSFMPDTIGSAPNYGMGISASNSNLDDYIGNDTDSTGYFSSGPVYIGGINQGSISAYTAGQRIDMALDKDNNKVWFRANNGNWDNNAGHDPATNTGGFAIAVNTSFASMSMLKQNDAGEFINAAGVVPSGFTAVNRGDLTTNVSQINDKSGNNNHATQLVIVSQGLHIPALYNGKDIIRFDGTDDFYSCNSLTGAENRGHTVITVFKLNDTGVGFLAVVTDAGNDGTGPANTQVFREATRYVCRYGNETGALWTDSNISDLQILTGYSTPQAAHDREIFKNGVTQGSVNTPNVVNNTPTKLRVGTQWNNTFGLDYIAMDFCEQLGYKGALTPATHAAVIAVSKAKWGIA